VIRRPHWVKKAVEIRWDPGHATVGSHPAVTVTHVQMGFDWDQGRIFLGTSEPIGKISAPLRRVLRGQENTLGRLHLAANRDKELPEITLKKLRQILDHHRARPDVEVAPFSAEHGS
jgi:hypothetical protein